KCPEKSNVRTYLDDLRMEREKLAAVGVDISEKDYLSTIIGSLPIHLSNFASNQLTAAQQFSPSKTINPDVLVSIISTEY
ncbi:hypothetical protein GG344DRAFT_30452, partial [Lentinula edodes]